MRPWDCIEVSVLSCHLEALWLLVPFDTIGGVGPLSESEGMQRNDETASHLGGFRDTCIW